MVPFLLLRKKNKKQTNKRDGDYIIIIINKNLIPYSHKVEKNNNNFSF